MRKFTRREFLKVGSAAVAGTALAGGVDLAFLQPVSQIENPLAFYPNRDWETVYRDQYRHDYSFTFVCAPNDTHNCRLRGFVRNGVLTRIEQPYDVAKYRDLYGNTATPTWNPRGCLKGLAYMRRVYSPFRVRYPMVRAGWKAWVEAGFPRGEDGLPSREYFRRGEDEWVRVSWEDAFALTAQAMLNIAETYSGDPGAEFLRAQGYPEEMLDTLQDADGEYAGVRTIKCRGGMAFLGATRLTACYRFGNMLALLDNHLRGKGPEKSLGARTWDNYAWHTDLPPGHPMVHGVQTFDQEFNDFWNSDLIIMTGLNLVSNKMADPIWWQSAMERKKKIVVISPEYSASSPKADYWLSIRPGTDTALMLGIAHLLIRRGLYDEAFVKRYTDFPFLVRSDSLKVLRYGELAGPTTLLDAGETYVDEARRPIQEMAEELKTTAVIPLKDGSLLGVTRTAVGDYLENELAGWHLSLDDLELDWKGEVQTGEGPVAVKTIFRLYRELTEEYTPQNTAALTGIPADKIQQLTEDIVAAKAVAFLTGMGLNMYFHNDLMGRAYYIVASLTGNVGKPGGNVGSYAGNYKAAVFNGLPSYVVEDPFNQTLDPAADGRDVKKRSYIVYESIHFWDHGDEPLIVDTPGEGRVVLTGKSHMPSPTKAVWAVNANLLGVAKWHYNLIRNVLPRQELYIAQDYEWNMNCEYADVVFPVDSWVEFKHPDMTASCTNPFVQMFPRGGIQRVHDSRHDIEVFAGVAAALADLTGEERFRSHWQFVPEDNVEVYLQRIIDSSTTLRGYDVRDMLRAERGFLTLFRTYPRIPGWEQIQESVPFYTRTGRLELYREEDEWIAQGENVVVHREPIEATPYQPRTIVAPRGLDVLRPKDYGIAADDTAATNKTVLNRVMTTGELLQTENPLHRAGYRFVLITPKPRHRVHSSWNTSDWNVIWASNFGDPFRHDKRAPWVGEEEMDINPEDARELGLEDGDYVYVDADPQDRPYIGEKEGDPFYQVSRLMIRARYNPALPRGMLIIIHGIAGATHRSVKAQAENPDGLAITDTGYAPCMRFGSQQSVVRAWLQPTQMTDSLVHKDYFTHRINQGFLVDVHTPTGAPKEVLVRVTKAEDGGLDGKGVWEPATTGFTPANESEAMKKYLKGEFIT
ncbi:MAG: molybdopterin-dependent oxidoreductase [Anaerolineae bacterium]